MVAISEPVPGETIAAAAKRIRTDHPILGDHATDADCTLRHLACHLTLTAMNVDTGLNRHWYTAQLATGHIAGVWAHGPAAAELDLSVWWEQDCAWVVEDDDLRIRHCYFRGAPNANHTFPVGPPRTPPHHFAPTTSLLETLTTTDGLGWL